MDDEQFERRLEFIVDQQTQFAVKIGQLEELVARLAQATRDRFELTDRRDDDTDRRISALVDSQMRTEESIRNLTAVVDRYFAEGRNGRSDSVG